MRRQSCGGCGSTGLDVFLDLGSSPPADRFPVTADEPEDWHPLQAAVCSHCWLVQLLDVVPDDMLYGADYGFRTGASPSAVAYFRDYADWALRTFGDLAGYVVELACNDGTLLQRFAEHADLAIGVEPAAGPAGVARSRGLDVIGEPFTADLAKRMVGENGRAGLVVANNVAAHVADLDDFFAGVATLTGGAAVIEVQYLADLLTGNQFDHVYHEHRHYFTVDSLNRVLDRHGMRIQSVRHTPAQGGSIRVVAVRGRGRDILAEDPSLRLPSTYLAFQGRVNHVRSRLHNLLGEEINAGRKIAGYGATAKSATLLNFCGLGPDEVDHVVDITPAKVGRYTPGSKIPIVAPGTRPEPDAYLLLAWNYLSGVLRREQSFHGKGGRFIVPIPMPVIL